MKLVCTIFAALSVGMAAALERSVTVPSVGRVSLTAAKPGGWAFDVAAETAPDGADVVRVRMRAPAPETPPVFAVRWQVSQRDVHHVWSSGSTHYGIPWSQPVTSEISDGLPLFAFLDANDASRFTCAASESCRRVSFTSPISEKGMLFNCAFTFFTVPEAPLDAYEVCVRFDAGRKFYAEAISSAADWMCAAAGITPLAAPESAFDPLYSTWYTFHQDVSAALVEEELALAAGLGMKTVIVDDGWQIDQPLGNRAWNGYRLCGDWKPGRNFPDMAAHVRRAHELGFKYMLWYSVPFVGEKSANFARFAGKYLPQENCCAGGWVLDPRFPDVREFLIGTYERAAREWGVDGFKFDFIGRFTLKGEDPAVRENYAGRDIRAIPLAVEKLLSDATARLKAIRPDILVEFRQAYIGPCIRRFGNMIRATDCPLSMVENRTRIARLRLTSGATAVHSDMLEWRADETPESAARCILNALFGTVQYSVRLKTLPETHLAMMRHWIAFSQRHRGALLHGVFRPRHPASDYPLLEGEDAAERVIGVYQPGLAVATGAADRPVYILNGANADSVIVDFAAAPVRLEAFDTFGNAVPVAPVPGAGLHRVKVPVSGYLKIAWRERESVKPFRFMTFNLLGSHYGVLKFTAREREDSVIATLRRHKPDIVSLQEVNGGWWDSKVFTAMDEYAAIRGDEDEALVRAGADLAKRRSNWVNHEPLMYRKDRFALLDSGLDFYHISIQFEKSLTWAVLEDKTDARRIIALATHFWWKDSKESDAIRELNARHVLARIGAIRRKWGNLPVVFGGDLNCEPDSMPLKTFALFGYDNAGTTAPIRSTVPSEHGDLVRDAAGKCRGRIGQIGKEGHCMIDHVFYSRGDFRPLRHDVVTDPDTLDVSDHSPVTVDFVLTPRGE